MICQQCWGSGVVCYAYDLCPCEGCAGTGKADCCDGDLTQPEPEVVKPPVLWHGPQEDREDFCK